MVRNSVVHIYHVDERRSYFSHASASDLPRRGQNDKIGAYIRTLSFLFLRFLGPEKP